MTVMNREDLLRVLESVRPGLSSGKDIVEQSSCFVFEKGDVITYQDEIACRTGSGFPKDFSGAISSEPLLNILRKLPEEDVEITEEDGELRVYGKKKKAGIRLQKDITLPVGVMETPEGWNPLHEEFSDALSLVSACCSRDKEQFRMTCVHLHPKWLEACDNVQACRWKMRTGIKEAALIRSRAAKGIASLSMVEVSETGNWIHFRNTMGLILSCRRYCDEYLDIGEIITNVQGHVDASLPKGLTEAVDRASVFSDDNAEDKQMLVELSTGRVKIRGQGASGWYEERSKIKYAGPAMTFRIAPKILANLVKKHGECTVGPGSLRINGGPYTLVTCLGAAPESPKKSED